MSDALGPMLGYLFVIGVILVVIFMIFREAICWYWKINQRIDLMTEIRDLLKANGQTLIGAASEAKTIHLQDAVDPAKPLVPTGPQGQCPNCESIIPLDSLECAKCRSLFGANSSWKVKPVKPNQFGSSSPIPAPVPK